MNYRAVFLDAGETILSPHPSFHEVIAAVLEEEGAPVDPADVERALGEMPPPQDPRVAWSLSRESSRAFWGGLYARILSSLGIDDRSSRLAGILYERFLRYESYRAFPDVVPTIEKMKAAGLYVGLISNFEEWLEEMLTHWEISELFDALIVSGKEGIEKPDPEIFRRALKRAEVPAAQAVYVGDHPKLDIEAAEAVGMTAILIDRRGRNPLFQGPKISALDELPALLGV